MENIINDKIIDLLIKESEVACKKGEVPVAAIIFDDKGKIVSKSHNSRQKKYSVIDHAEINAILKAEKKIKDWRLDGYFMAVTLEPCDMCSVVIKECRLEKVFYLLKKNGKVNIILDNKDEIKGYIKEKEVLECNLKKFFSIKR